MNFLKTIFSVYRKSFDFKTQSSRLEFGRYLFYYMIASMLGTLVRIQLGMIEMIPFSGEDLPVELNVLVMDPHSVFNQDVILFSMAEMLFLGVPLMALVVRRSRNIGLSGFKLWAFMVFLMVPPFTLLALGFLCLKKEKVNEIQAANSDSFVN